MIRWLIKRFKNIFKKKAYDFSITYVVPYYISDREAEDRVSFVDSCLNKTKWSIYTKEKFYNIPFIKSAVQKILEENTYEKSKVYFKYNFIGDPKEFRSELIRVFTENLGTVALSSIDHSDNFELLFVLESTERDSWLVLEFIKEYETWYLHGVNSRGW